MALPRVVSPPCDDVPVSTSTRSAPRSYGGRHNSPRLTAPGLVILQSLLISVGLVAELLIRHKVAFFAGAIILITFAGGVIFARPKIAPLAAVVPPLATFFGLILFLPTVGPSSFSLTSMGLDISASLANIAPYLLFGALGAWGIAFYRRS
jgi:hypothetical protein